MSASMDIAESADTCWTGAWRGDETSIGVFTILGRELNAADTPRKAAEVILKAADRLLGWDASSLLYCDDAGLLKTVVNYDVFEGKRVEFPPLDVDCRSASIAWQTVQAGPRLILRKSAFEIANELYRFGDTLRASASLMFVPVRHGQRTVGVISIQSYTPDAYSPDDLKALQGLADHCGGALERIRMSGELEAERARLRAIVDATPECVKVIAPDGTLLEMNQAGLVFVEADSWEEVANQCVYNLIAPEFREAFRAFHERVCRGERGVLEFEIVGLKGTRRFMETHAVPLRHPGRNELCHLAVTRDITERKKAAEALRQSEQRHRRLIEALPDAIAVRRGDRFVFMNAAAVRLFGGSLPDDLLGRSPLEFVHPDFRERVRQRMQQTDAGQELPPLEQRLVRADGRIVEVEVSAVRMMFEDEPAAQMVLRDITERKKFEAQLLRTQRMESIGHLAGGIAHDLNNVLAPVLISMQLLRDTLSDPIALQLVRTAQESAQRGADIVQQLLTFGRGMDGKRILLQPAHLLKELARMARETFPRSIQINTRQAGELWPVTGDPTQLHQVLLNLMINARDAMQAGGQLTIGSRNAALDESAALLHPAARPGSYLTIRVTDTGTGIPTTVLDRIFDPFFTTKEQGKGSGLGLFTAMGIVKNHEGFITVESEVGKGTSVTVYLPAQPKAAAEQNDTRQITLPRGEGELILVVDDEAAIRDIARRLLERYGYRVVLAEDGPQAAALFAGRKDEIQAVVIDMMMPNMDGGATIRVLQRIKPDVRVIAASGLGHPAKVEEMQQLGAVAFLHKPYTANKLLTTLAQVFGRQA